MMPPTSDPRKRAAGALLLCALSAATLVALPNASFAATTPVAVRDNRFDAKEIRIDPGDTVVWTNQGARVHDVTADDRSFKSPDLRTGDRYSHTFEKEGYYFYHCSFHGAKRAGMWGVVIVGNPPPPKDLTGIESAKLVVPTEFPTIQKAVNSAKPHSVILIQPGIYREEVVVQTDDLTIKGVDRFRTVLNGRDRLDIGITVDGTRNVKVKNLTVRNYLRHGVFFNNVRGYTASRIDAIKDRTYGIYALDSYDGVIKNSFAWGSGDGAIYIGQCLGCSALIENVTAQYSYLGYSGTNSTGVVIRNSVFKHNAAGIVPNTLPTENYGPNRGTTILNNLVVKNNYATIPAAGFSDNPVGIPIGTGIWLPGVENHLVRNNVVKHHKSYGILVSQSLDTDPPMNNTVVSNLVRDSDSDEDGYGYDLAWDGYGANNCFSFNNIKGPTAPPDIQMIYACDRRPFPGVHYAPVTAHLAMSATNSHTRDQKEPPEPDRPRCQRGTSGCSR